MINTTNKLQKYATITLQLMRKYGLKGWRFSYNRRVRLLGICNHTRKVIQLSENFVLLNRDWQIRDVILHEIAHALVGVRQGHGKVWQDKARELGAIPQSCRPAKLPPYTYRAICNECDARFYRYRQVKNVHRGSYNYCENCGKRKGRLVFVKGRYPVS